MHASGKTRSLLSRHAAFSLADNLELVPRGRWVDYTYTFKAVANQGMGDDNPSDPVPDRASAHWG